MQGLRLVRDSLLTSLCKIRSNCRNYLEEDDYHDLARALESFTSIKELSLSFDSNEMGDECFSILYNSFKEYEYLEKLNLNVSRNLLSAEVLAEAFAEIENLGMLNHLVVRATKNLRHVEQKEKVNSAANKLMVKNKKIAL